MEHHDRLLAWLLPGEPTADIGSGSGVDLAWLVAEGFPAIGFEPVKSLRKLAVETFPEIEVRCSSLPDLVDVPDGAFGNVVCSAVLMHLPLESIPPAVDSLARVLRPGGRLLLSIRAGKAGAEREEDGRLFTPIPAELLEQSLRDAGLRTLHQSANEDQSRPGVTWTEVIAEKATVE